MGTCEELRNPGSASLGAVRRVCGGGSSSTPPGWQPGHWVLYPLEEVAY